MQDIIVLETFELTGESLHPNHPLQPHVHGAMQGYYDLLQYPILFPYGTYRWDINTTSHNGRCITCRVLQLHATHTFHE
ncbi:hypothetical protein Lal_00018930 [Lupinus albus]|nr:hypothetical protein Lal_00018930 [Lupinus albus]